MNKVLELHAFNPFCLLTRESVKFHYTEDIHCVLELTNTLSAVHGVGWYYASSLDMLDL